jgi:hypothetical protein
MGQKLHHHVSEDMLRSARALLKFSREHGYSCGGLAPLQSCIAALESGDFSSAIKEFERMPFGKGSFDDWFPPVVYEHEDGDYVWAVFEALVERFYRLFRTAVGKLVS